MSGGIDLATIIPTVISTLQTTPPFDEKTWATKVDGTGRIQAGFGPEVEAWEQITEPEGMIVSIFPMEPEEDSAYGGISNGPTMANRFKVPLTLVIKAVNLERKQTLVDRVLMYGQAALLLRGRNLGTVDCPVWAWPARPTFEPMPYPKDYGGSGPVLLLVRFDLDGVAVEF